MRHREVNLPVVSHENMDSMHGQLVVGGELVAAIAHDLRQPLTAIEMNVEAAVRWLEAHERRLGDDAPARELDEAIAALRDALTEQRQLRLMLQVMTDGAPRDASPGA